MDVKSALDRIYRGGISTVLRELDEEVVTTEYYDTYCDIVNEYSMLLDYYQLDVTDNRRNEVYNHLKRKTVALLHDYSLDKKIEKESNLRLISQSAEVLQPLNLQDLKHGLEKDMSEYTLAGLMNGDERGEEMKVQRKMHYEYMSKIFNALLVSHHWRAGEVDMMREILLTPTIDSVDQQIMVSALMLNVMLSSDYHKILLLIDIYQQSTDDYVKERAFVGWALSLVSLDYMEPLLADRLKSLIKDESVVNDLLQLQLQLSYSLSVESDTKVIKDDIIADIMKTPQMDITRFGIDDDDSIEDAVEEIINSGAMKDAYDKADKAMERLKNMLNRGSDVYYDGFSHMKTFDFFKDVSHWFTPFQKDHPGLNGVPAELMNGALVDRLLAKSPLCDSDKYSFLISLGKTINLLPAGAREMLNNSDNIDVVGLDEGLDSPIIIRRLYLQDVYRFFKVYSGKTSFPKIFNLIPDTDSNGQLRLLPIDNEVFDDTIVHDSIDYYKMKGYFCKKNRLFDKACDVFAEAEKRNLVDDNLRKSYASVAFNAGRYEKSLALYDEISENNVSKNIEKHRCACLTNLGRVDEALPILYKFVYEDETDVTVQKMLANCLMQKGEYDKAARYYDDILKNNATLYDERDASICYLFLGRKKDAIESMLHYMEQRDKSDMSVDVSDIMQEVANAFKGMAQTDVSVRYADVLLLVEYSVWEYLDID